MDIISAPEVVIIEVTGEQIWKAIEKNGIPYVRESWFDTEGPNSAVHSACILGQGAINLGVTANHETGHERPEHSLFAQLNLYANDAGKKIINTFDSRASVIEVLDPDELSHIRRLAIDDLNGARRQYLTLRTIFLSKLEPDQLFVEEDVRISSDDGYIFDATQYYQYSVKETLKYVEHTLTPYFDTVFQLQTKEYKVYAPVS